MRFTEFSAFTFVPGRDVVLHLKRTHPWIFALVVGGFLVALLLFTVWAADPDWNPGHIRGRGAWVIGLLLLLPIIARGLLLVLLIGFLAEGAYRNAYRIYDRKPDFVIGPSGIADLDPWNPKAILWEDVIGITRVLSRDTLFTPRETLALNFRAPAKRPRWIPDQLWKSLPGSLTQRTITLMPDALGTTEEEILRVVERFGGRFPVDDVSSPG